MVGLHNNSVNLVSVNRPVWCTIPILHFVKTSYFQNCACRSHLRNNTITLAGVNDGHREIPSKRNTQRQGHIPTVMESYSAYVQHIALVRGGARDLPILVNSTPNLPWLFATRPAHASPRSLACAVWRGKCPIFVNSTGRASLASQCLGGSARSALALHASVRLRAAVCLNPRHHWWYTVYQETACRH